jgi:hypothetical protein
MQTLVLNSVPDGLYAKLRRLAEKRQSPLDIATIDILEKAVSSQEPTPVSPGRKIKSRWSQRRLIPGYQKLMRSGNLLSDIDSTSGLSEERDAR